MMTIFLMVSTLSVLLNVIQQSNMLFLKIAEDTIGDADAVVFPNFI